MKIILESEKDLNKFLHRNRQIGRTEVIIDGKLLTEVIEGYKRRIENLESEKYVVTNNLVTNWILENIETINYGETEETKTPEAEIRKSCIDSIKKELSNLKAEADLSSVNMADRKYNFLFMVKDCYNLEPEAIIKKVEKDLAEIEVPVNAVEEGTVETN